MKGYTYWQFDKSFENGGYFKVVKTLDHVPNGRAFKSCICIEWFNDIVGSRSDTKNTYNVMP